jgi:Domain of unknown function (DUF4388)
MEMTELSGTLEGVGLPAIVRFLAGLGKTGALRISHENWHGEVYFDDGLVVGAELGSRRGVSALDGLIRALPGGTFVFDAEGRPEGPPNIDFKREQLLAHLDGADDSGPPLPSLDTVPHMMPQDDDGSAEETVPLDRGTLQTLLAIDGVRTVREVIGVRGSFEALWQVANLAQVGLVRLEPPATAAAVVEPEPSKPKPSRRAARSHAVATAAPAPSAGAVPAAPSARAAAATPPPAAAASTPAATGTAAAPTMSAAASVPATPGTAAPSVSRPASAPVTPSTAPSAPRAVQPFAPASVDVVHCPKLGFEDDPSSSFGRPTRLHRCFAAGTPLPLSLDQQRELCLSDQYGTCPRLSMAGLTPAAPKLVPPPSVDLASSESQSAPTEDDPRIVRLPVGGRPAAGVRPATPASPTPAAPTPLRARSSRTGSAAAAIVVEPVSDTPPAAEPAESAPPVRSAARASIVFEQPRRLPALALPALPLPGSTITAIAIVVVVLGIVGALLVPRLGDLFSDEQGVDMSALPNSSAVASGTPISELPSVRPTVDAAAQASSASQASPSVDAAASRPQPTAAPTLVPTVVPTVPAGPRTILDENFDSNASNWPNNPQGTAWITGGSYHIQPRQAGQFVAIAAPAVGEILQDVVVNATFHKLGGPAGGGYGIIVRDQGPGPRDGNNQQGRYYVLEVGDKGEIGIWRRDGDKWIDLLPWTRSDAVKPGSQPNELTVRAVGDRLSLSVNGTEVGVRNDALLAVGNVGIFVGGDGNQVAVDQFSIKTP